MLLAKNDNIGVHKNGRIWNPPLRYTNTICTNSAACGRGWRPRHPAKNDYDIPTPFAQTPPRAVGDGALDIPRKTISFVRTKTGGYRIRPYDIPIFQIDFAYILFRKRYHNL